MSYVSGACPKVLEILACIDVMILFSSPQLADKRRKDIYSILALVSTGYSIAYALVVRLAVNGCI